MELKAKILSQVILQSQLLSTPHLTLHYTLVSGIVFCFSIISHILGKYTWWCVFYTQVQEESYVLRRLPPTISEEPFLFLAQFGTGGTDFFFLSSLDYMISFQQLPSSSKIMWFQASAELWGQCWSISG